MLEQALQSGSSIKVDQGVSQSHSHLVCRFSIKHYYDICSVLLTVSIIILTLIIFCLRKVIQLTILVFVYGATSAFINVQVFFYVQIIEDLNTDPEVNSDNFMTLLVESLSLLGKIPEAVEVGI